MRTPSTTAVVRQRTLKDAITLIGIGLHSGRRVRLKLCPAPPDTGIRFRRTDLRPGAADIEARWHNVAATALCTQLGNWRGTTVATVEHLLAALRAGGVDNLLVELNGPEVPIMDGSALPFAALIEAIGTVAQSPIRYALVVRKPVQVADGDRYAMLLPASQPQVGVVIVFPGVGRQGLDYDPAGGDFLDAIAPARTFGFAAELGPLRRRGLVRGGNLNNAILLDGGRVVNEEGLRFPDELVRHKLLDVLGDLALVGGPIVGRYLGYKPGHKLNHALLARLFAEPEAWSYQPLAGNPPADRAASPDPGVGAKGRGLL